MPQLIVTISDMKSSRSSEDVIVTYSLGSCIGVTAYDPKAGIGGLVHCLLPEANLSRRRSKDNPFMFVDSGLSTMVRQLIEMGAKKSNLIFKAAGGANMRGDYLFNTGKRNFEALERLMERSGVVLSGQDVGGTIPRTMLLHMDTGRVVVRSLGEEKEL